MLKRVALSVGILLASFSLSACEGVKETFGIANRTPVIASFDYNPKSGLTKNDVITFSVVANDPEGKSLQYNWTATKGILTANSGSTVSWRPIKLDNTFESGLTNVSVLVSDGFMTNTASVNIFINGETITVDSNPIVTPSPSVSPVVSPSATVAPSVSPTVVPTANPTPIPTVIPTPTAVPTVVPTAIPTSTTTPVPSATPTIEPTPVPTPTVSPSIVVTSPTPSASSSIIVSQ